MNTVARACGMASARSTAASGWRWIFVSLLLWLTIAPGMAATEGALGAAGAASAASATRATSAARAPQPAKGMTVGMAASPAGAASTPPRAAASPRSTSVADDLGVLLPGAERRPGETAYAVRVVLGLTLLAIIPSLLVCLTSFLRIAIVLSMLRHAIGMPETPPNTVLVGLALFLTLFTMNPVLQAVGKDSLQPFLQGQLGVQESLDKASRPLRKFMVRQTREQDLALMVELSKSPKPSTIDDVGLLQLIPAFMLSELRAAFQIGFVVFLPFLLIDLIVSSILMALGMMMMPPSAVSLPVKILMFVLVDGWSLIVKALVGSFH